jgi:hypothetical protein
MVSIFTRFFTQNILIEQLRMNNGFTRIIFFDRPLKDTVTANINWAKLYPFKTRVGSSMRANVFGSFKNKITNIEEKVENYTTEGLINSLFFVETAVKYEIACG